MNINRLIKQLEIDEGVKHRVYLDTEGLPTVGIGHLIKESDPDWVRNLKVGDIITDKQIQELFLLDLATATQDAVLVFDDKWEDFPSEAQEVIINMIFNLGRTRFSKFKKTIYAAYTHDWETMSVEMLDSKWARQVGARASRLSKRIKALA